MAAGFVAFGQGMRQLRLERDPEYRAATLRSREACLKKEIARDRRNIGQPGCHLQAPEDALAQHTAKLQAVQSELQSPMPYELSLEKKIARDRERMGHRGLCQFLDPQQQLARHQRKLDDLRARRIAAAGPPPLPYAG